MQRYKSRLLLTNLSRLPEQVLRGVWSTFPTKKPQAKPTKSELCHAEFPSFCFPVGTIHLWEWPGTSLCSSWASSSLWPLSNPNGATRPSPTIPTPVPAPAAALQAHNTPSFPHNKLSLPRLDALFHSMDFIQLQIFRMKGCKRRLKKSPRARKI